MAQKSIVFFLLFFPIVIFAQAPAWLVPQYRLEAYPEEKYLSSFVSEASSSEKNTEELLQKLSIQAQQLLAESIKIEVSSIARSQILIEDGITTEHFNFGSLIYTEVPLIGVKRETYWDKKDKTAYTFVYIDKKTLYAYYQANYQAQLSQAEELIANVNLDKPLHEEDYSKCLQALHSIQQAAFFVELQLAIFPSIEIDFKQYIQLSTLVNRQINVYTQSKIAKPEECLDKLYQALELQLKSAIREVSFLPFTYQNTALSSPLGMWIAKGLQAIQAKHSMVHTSNESPYEALGTYQKQAEGILVRVFVRDPNHQNYVATAQVLIPHVLLEKIQLEATPENLTQSLAQQKLFAKEEIKKPSLLLDIWTNHGKHKVVYTAGEEARFFVKVNKACYLRFVYHLADGSQVLLLDNFYLDNSLVNQNFELPYQFECAAPFGAETLQVNASTQAFKPLITYQEDGYTFIKGGLKDTLLTTRGLKDKNKLLQAEKRLLITTLAD